MIPEFGLFPRGCIKSGEMMERRTQMPAARCFRHRLWELTSPVTRFSCVDSGRDNVGAVSRGGVTRLRNVLLRAWPLGELGGHCSPHLLTQQRKQQRLRDGQPFAPGQSWGENEALLSRQHQRAASEGVVAPRGLRFAWSYLRKRPFPSTF